MTPWQEIKLFRFYVIRSYLCRGYWAALGFICTAWIFVLYGKFGDEFKLLDWLQKRLP
jgi:hypothetical protein